MKRTSLFSTIITKYTIKMKIYDLVQGPSTALERFASLHFNGYTG